MVCGMTYYDDKISILIHMEQLFHIPFEPASKMIEYILVLSKQTCIMGAIVSYLPVPIHFTEWDFHRRVFPDKLEGKFDAKFLRTFMNRKCVEILPPGQTETTAIRYMYYPLSWAVMNQYAKIVEFLCQQGADVMVDHRYPLRATLRDELFDMFEVLVRHGHVKHRYECELANDAVVKGRLNIIRYLYRSGRLTAQDDMLLTAIRANKGDVVECLLDLNVYSTHMVRKLQAPDKQIASLLSEYEQCA